jgi:hypothetical protein
MLMEYKTVEARCANERKVGVELEFLRPSAREAAEALARYLGGSCIALDPHSLRISSSRFGEMVIETDLRHVHPARHPELGWRLNNDPQLGSARWYRRLFRGNLSPVLCPSPFCRR